MSETTTIFLPCRAGSTRVPLKNTRPFAGNEGGLLGVKLDQMERVRGVDRVVVDSNDPLVLSRATARKATWSGTAELVIVERPNDLGRSETTTDELIAWALKTVETDVLAWTHVTSPLFGATGYESALQAFRERDAERHDSLMSVTALRTFLWDHEGAPLNYARSPIRWPRTQDLTPAYEVNSAIFIVPRSVGLANEDRIGARPLLWEMSGIDSLDVDWEDDFRLAEAAYLTLRANS